MYVLGIDPGSNVAGYALIRVDGDYIPVAVGTFRGKATASYMARLRTMIHDLEHLIGEWHHNSTLPEFVFFEDQFVRFAKSAVAVAAARGVFMGVFLRLPLMEVELLTATEVKKAMTGKGNATKEEVAAAALELCHSAGSLDLDASDALAIAIAGTMRKGFGGCAMTTGSR